MVYGMDVNDVICERASGEDVEGVNGSHSLVEAVSKYVNIKFSSFIFDFGNIHSNVKNIFYFKYCTSYYGSNMCSFYDMRGMETLY